MGREIQDIGDAWKDQDRLIRSEHRVRCLGETVHKVLRPWDDRSHGRFLHSVNDEFILTNGSQILSARGWLNVLQKSGTPHHTSFSYPECLSSLHFRD